MNEPNEERQPTPAESLTQTRFEVGELIPLKGIQFEVVLVHEAGIALRAKRLTHREKKRLERRTL